MALKIMRMTNLMTDTKDREVWHKLVDKTENHKGCKTTRRNERRYKNSTEIAYKGKTREDNAYI